MKQRHILFVLGMLLTLTACAAFPNFNETVDNMTGGSSTQPDSQRIVASLPDLGEAPELTNTIWLNTPDEQPLRLATLRGKVVLLDFWTYG
jgi:hypothetical protein